MTDRTVHSRYLDMEIVRYDREDKWYLEPTIPMLKRQHVTIKKAVAASRWGINNAGGQWYPRLPGGKRFDELMQESE